MSLKCRKYKGDGAKYLLPNTPTSALKSSHNSQKTPCSLFYNNLTSQKVHTALNHQTYSGQKLAFRQSHKRDFISTCKEGMSVVLIDDIVTTETTLQEAQKVLEKGGVNVLFALVLANAKEN